MHEDHNNTDEIRGPVAWAKFVAGTMLLTCAVLLLMQGYAPPGPAGDVFRHNLENRIDATPFFYTEVESLMPDE